MALGVWAWAEITVNVTLPPLSIIRFQSIVVGGFVRQLGDDASKMGSIARGGGGGVGWWGGRSRQSLTPLNFCTHD